MTEPLMTAKEIRKGTEKLPLQEAKAFLKDSIQDHNVVLVGASGKIYSAGDVDRMKEALVRKLVAQVLLDFCGHPVGKVVGGS